MFVIFSHHFKIQLFSISAKLWLAEFSQEFPIYGPSLLKVLNEDKTNFRYEFIAFVETVQRKWKEG